MVLLSLSSSFIPVQHIAAPPLRQLVWPAAPAKRCSLTAWKGCGASSSSIVDRSPPKTRYDLCAGHYQCRQIDVLVPFSVYTSPQQPLHLSCSCRQHRCPAKTHARQPLRLRCSAGSVSHSVRLHVVVCNVSIAQAHHSRVVRSNFQLCQQHDHVPNSLQCGQ